MLTFLTVLRKKSFYVKQLRYVYAQQGQWEDKLTAELKLQIEEAWKDKCHQTSGKINSKEKKMYVLSMFPYPSGKLHLGHVRVYTISDVMARFYRMQGKQVIHPMGWDAFGLPAENAAIEKGIPPKEWTTANIEYMRAQLKKMACTFDWDREIATCDPSYYKWTQFIFIKLLESGLAYRKEAPVNWDPIDQTVLADEQVDENGCSWRSGAKVEKRRLNQWFIRTSAFAPQLFDGLSEVNKDDWKDIIKMQKNWIGKCNGHSFTYDLILDGKIIDKLQIWTDRAELLADAKFVGIRSAEFLSSDCDLTNLRAENPVNGELLPVFVTEKILYPVGSDMIVGIPSDQNIKKPESCRHLLSVYEFCQEMNISTSYELLSKEEAMAKKKVIVQKLLSEGRGGYLTSSRLRDWLISRQRYWGTPIPAIHCNQCGVLPVPAEHLPVVLPDLSGFSKKGHSALKDCTEWLNTQCHNCGGPAVRETDTMDTFVDSSWYFIRYLDPKNSREIADKTLTDLSLPVDLYIGGKEHATLHLFYARFICHFLHSIGLVPTREPFTRLLTQGMVKGKTYRLQETGKYLTPDEVVFDGEEAVEKDTGEPVIATWEKMSKSKFNGVEPEEIFDKYGIDTSRLLILANVPPRGDRNWSDETIPGVTNWQNRIWAVLTSFRKAKFESDVQTISKEGNMSSEVITKFRDVAVKGVNYHMNSTYFLSSVISILQGFTNDLLKVPDSLKRSSPEYENALSSLIIMLYPFAPHFSAELWSGFTTAVKEQSKITNSKGIDLEKQVWEQPWPQEKPFDRCYVGIQIDGVKKGHFHIGCVDPSSLTPDFVFAKADKDKRVSKFWKNAKIVSYEISETFSGGITFAINTDKSENT
ncbi:leucine--tRNA ligase, mitochondrial-like isoform X1 [Artemia franciscana]